ncbi:MAG: alpha/beta fold hydrolase [Woeseiaceae bacterium]|nr:alpha/beta fold hydrolase [Woeseiaceae bacterium]
MHSVAVRLTLIALLFPLAVFAGPVSVALHDGETAAAKLNIVDDGTRAALLLHQCNRDQSMWAPLVDALNERGVSTMTVDLRGYGESGTATYNVREHGFDTVVENVGKDILSINNAWRDATADADRRVVIGASCGGGLATRLTVEADDIDALLLFSPSLRSRWLPDSARDGLERIRQLPALAVVAEDDTAAVESIGLVFDRNASPLSQRITYKGGLHGQPLFEHDPLLATVMASWIERVLDSADAE